jgi:hypothetical protein
LFALRFAFVRRARRTRAKEVAKSIVFAKGVSNYWHRLFGKVFACVTYVMLAYPIHPTLEPAETMLAIMSMSRQLNRTSLR